MSVVMKKISDLTAKATITALDSFLICDSEDTYTATGTVPKSKRVTYETIRDAVISAFSGTANSISAVIETGQTVSVGNFVSLTANGKVQRGVGAGTNYACGVATTAGTAGQTISVSVGGLCTISSGGFTAGQLYYGNETTGAIGTAKSTIKLGVALSTTVLLLDIHYNTSFINSQTLKSNPSISDEIKIADSATSYTEKKITIDSLCGLITPGLDVIHGTSCVTLLASNSLTYMRVGDAATSNHTFNSNDDLVVTGKFESVGDSYLATFMKVDVTSSRITISDSGSARYTRLGTDITATRSLSKGDVLVTGETELNGPVYFNSTADFSIDATIQGNSLVRTLAYLNSKTTPSYFFEGSGGNTYLQVTANDSYFDIVADEDITFECIFETGVLSQSNGYLFSKQNDLVGYGVFISSASIGLRIENAGGSYVSLLGSNVLQANKKAHVFITLKDLNSNVSGTAAATLYFNGIEQSGVLVPGLVGNTFENTGKFTIGAKSTAPSTVQFRGQIYAIRMYNKALTEAEIQKKLFQNLEYSEIGAKNRNELLISTSGVSYSYVNTPVQMVSSAGSFSGVSRCKFMQITSSATGQVFNFSTSASTFGTTIGSNGEAAYGIKHDITGLGLLQENKNYYIQFTYICSGGGTELLIGTSASSTAYITGLISTSAVTYAGNITCVPGTNNIGFWLKASGSPVKARISDVIIRQEGCIVEFVPNSMSPQGWVETQQGAVAYSKNSTVMVNEPNKWKEIVNVTSLTTYGSTYVITDPTDSDMNMTIQYTVDNNTCHINIAGAYLPGGPSSLDLSYIKLPFELNPGSAYAGGSFPAGAVLHSMIQYGPGYGLFKNPFAYISSTNPDRIQFLDIATTGAWTLFISGTYRIG